MKIISINSETKMIATINCNCGTLFEFESSDMLIKGRYSNTYHVNCPTCNESHNHTENMSENHKEEVAKYIDNCRSCMQCKYLAEIKVGYSSYTVTDISIQCKIGNNKNMPLSGYEDRNEMESVYAHAEKCTDFKNGIRYVKEVEESEMESFKRWEKANINYKNY